MTNESGLEFEKDEETTAINTVKTGDYDVVSSVFHYREKEMPQKLGCAADYDDTCFPCHAKGIWCERAEEMKKKMPPPMTIEMENDTFKNSENIKVSHGNVDCVNVCDADRKAALDALAIWEGKTFSNEAEAMKWFGICMSYHAGTIRATLQSPRVPVIEGLEDALKKYSFDMPDMSDYESVGHYLNDEAEYRKASSIVEKAARAYSELQKGN